MENTTLKIARFSLHRCWSILLSGVLLMIAQNSVSSPLVINPDESTPLELTEHVKFLVDSNGELNINQVKLLTFEKFPSQQGSVINFGVTKNTYWGKVEIRNNAANQFIQLQEPLTDELELYFVDSENNIKKLSKSGSSRPFNTRELESPIYFFKIPQGNHTLYFKIRSNWNMQIPIKLGGLQNLVENQYPNDFLLAMYIGLMLIMLVYNSFIFFSTRAKSHFYYLLYIFSVTLFYSTLKGVSFQFLWPSNPSLNYYVPSFASIINIFGALFIIHLLNVKAHLPKLMKWVYLAIGIFASCVVINFAGYYQLSSKISQTFTSLYIVFFLSIAFYLLKKGVRTAKFFLIAWSLFLISVIVFILTLNGILPYNTFTNNVVLAGSALEALLLSFALADMINTLKREKEEEQAEKLEALKENERIIANQNAMLKEQVDEKTKELRSANEELSDALTDLKNTQVSLVESEKMASLGQLTAGVAHEINNPINFVSSNVNPLIRDFEDVREFIGTILEKAQKNEHVDSTEISNLFEELDIAYTQQEISDLLQGIKEGANRTAEIVKGLKNFSRLDEAAFKTANLEEGLDSTLILLRSNMKGEISLIKDYAGIPKIDCYAGKLNQVFMNLINNSIYAILQDPKKEEKGEGRLTIKTENKEKDIIISIQDNGMGMDEETKAKLFDPFFTTKPVGEGTGLGMSITYSIINDMHKGSVEIESEKGVGTTITMHLPKNLNK